MLKKLLPKPNPPKPPPNLNKKQHILTLLKQCNSLRHLKQIHSQMLINSLQNHNFLLSKLIQLKDLPYATLHFSQIHNPNDFTYNTMIRGLTKTWSNYTSAIQLYHQMRSSQFRPNNYTYPFVLIACANLNSLNIGRTTHSSVLKAGLGSDGHVAHCLITMYSRCGQLGCARRVFDGILERDLVSWNSMISGYSKAGYAEEAVGMFGRMREEGFGPSETTLVSVLGACGDLGGLELGRWVEGFAGENGFALNSFLGSALISMYGKCGDLESAKRVFEGMTTRDSVTWNALITGYAQNGVWDKAINTFQQMRSEGTIEPDNITMVGVLSACASIGALELGSWIDKHASQKGVRHDVYVGTALIDMYSKCGDLDHALQIFNGMRLRNTVSWNVMISALASHGRPQEALSLFGRMREEKDKRVSPDDITFIGVLSACVHVGWVEVGRGWFESMRAEFGLVPKIEHYTCMVDLLARAGRLDEACEFIESMPEKPDGVTLGTVLCACRKFNNVKVGERIANMLLEVEPSNSGNYVISSKLYANSKRWEDSAKMKGLMRERGVVKTPGCSWIEGDDQVHEFRSGDGSHYRAGEINLMMDLLCEEMRTEGYIPNLSLV